MLSHVASPRAPTGAERSLALLASGLVARGRRVGVTAPGPWSLADGLTDAGVAVANVPSRAVWMTYHDSLAWPIAAAKALRAACPVPGRGPLRRHLRERAPDVVHVNGLPHVRGVVAARELGLPVVWHLREILPAGPRRRWFARRLAAATHVVAVSEAVARWVRAEGVDVPTTVVHNGVAPADAVDRAAARRAVGLDADRILVGHFGQLVPHKASLEFVRAAARALAAGADAGFVVAGAGPATYVRRVDDEIGAIAAAYGPDRVVRLPPRSDPAPLFAAVDVVCVATETPDPLPRSVLEAMAAGRAVIASRTGGAPEMVEDGITGVLVEPGNVAELGDAFARVVRDPGALASMGRAGRAAADARFGIDRHVDRMLGILDAAAAGDVPGAGA